MELVPWGITPTLMSPILLWLRINRNIFRHSLPTTGGIEKSRIKSAEAHWSGDNDFAFHGYIPLGMEKYGKNRSIYQNKDQMKKR